MKSGSWRESKSTWSININPSVPVEFLSSALATLSKIRNTKFDIRNNIQIRIFKFSKQEKVIPGQTPVARVLVLNFGHSVFEFVSDFDPPAAPERMPWRAGI